MHRSYSWLLPSFGAFFVAAVFLNLFWEQDSFLSSPEICRYLNDGARIHHENGIALNDSFTLAPTAWQWVNIKWGTCLLVYLLYSWGGFSAIALYFHGLLAATMFILYRSLVRSGAGMFTVVTFMTVIYALFHYKFLLHAHLFSYLFMASLVGAFRMRSTPTLLDWLVLPIMFVFWGNLDNGWLCGIFFMGVSLFGRWIDTPSDPAKPKVSLKTQTGSSIEAQDVDKTDEKEPVATEPLLENRTMDVGVVEEKSALAQHPPAGSETLIAEPPLEEEEEEEEEEQTYPPERPELKQIRLWFRMIVACFFCALLNPVVFLFNISTVGVYFDYLMRPIWYVHETPDFSGPSAPALIILFVLICLLASRFVTDRPVTSFESGLTIFFFMELALKGQEQAWLLLIVAAVPLARDADALVRKFLGGVPVFMCSEAILGTWQNSETGDFIWGAALCVVLGASWAVQPRLTDILTPDSSCISSPCAAFIKAHADHFKRCLTAPEAGSAIIWFVPGSKVTIDERAEFLGLPFFAAIAQTLELATNWTHTIRYGKFDSAVLVPRYPVNTGLQEIPGWTLVYSDDLANVYFNEPPPEKSPAAPTADVKAALPTTVVAPSTSPSKMPTPTPHRKPSPTPIKKHHTEIK